MFSSIRTRLTLWYVGIFALFFIAFASTIYLLVSRNLSQTVNENLKEIANSISADLRKEEADLAAERISLAQSDEKDEKQELDEDDKKKAEDIEQGVYTIESAIGEAITDLRFRAFGFQIMDQNGKEIASSVTDSRLRETLKDLSAESSFADVQGARATFRVSQTFLNLEGKPFKLLITYSLSEQTEFLAGLKQIFFVIFPVALILAGFGGYFLARRSLAPVVSMSDQAARIGSSNLNERLAVQNENDELGGLARVFNSLLSRLEITFDHQRRFMADASHELRTPLSILLGESEVALSKQDRSPEEYRESLSVIQNESRRLSRIVDDLFTLARADSDQLKPVFTTVSLNEILLECIHAVGILAQKKNVRIEFLSSVEMQVNGDETLLHRLFLNLLDNAIKYNRNGGAVCVELKTDDKSFSVVIADQGDGITDEDLPRIFERFFRADKARTRENTNGAAGVGLGLSIAAWIAEIHNAEILIEKSNSSGSTFVVIFSKNLSSR